MRELTIVALLCFAHSREATSFNYDLSLWNVMRVAQFTNAFLDASSFSQQLCWQMRETVIVLRMFCGTNGASIKAECVCEQDLYYDEECVNPSRVEEMSCDPPSLRESSALPGSSWMVAGAFLVMSATASLFGIAL